MKARIVSVAKLCLFLLGLAPLARMLYLGWQSYRGIGDGLGANPIERVTHATGDAALYFLLASLAVTPLRRLFSAGVLVRFRRMLGLFAFAYASLHFATYVFDRAYVEAALDWPSILRDIAKRPYITVGVAALTLMVPLAITSTQALMRRLGKRWQTLHRLVYACAVLVILHYTWLVKADLRRPLIFGAVLFVLLGVRVVWWMRTLRDELRRGATRPD